MRMEAKSVVVSLVLVSVIVGVIEVEAIKICCPSNNDRNKYNLCRIAGAPADTCAKRSGCKLISGTKCPSDYPKTFLQNTHDDDVSVNQIQFCKLGCAFSVCATLQNYGEDVDEAVEKCNDACSDICTNTSVEAA